MEFPATDPVQVRDVLDVASLVAYLRRETRERPVVILTVARGQREPYVAAAGLAKEAAGRADIVTIPNDDLTRSFANSLTTPAAGVFGGACRVYPAGETWESNPFGVPLRMARTKVEIDALPRLIAEDLRRELARPPARAVAEPSPVKVAATVVAVPAPPGGRTSIAAATPRAAEPLVEVATPADAEALAAALRNPARDRPTVVVSRATGAPYAYADVPELRRDLAGLADVVEITALEASWAFSRAMPDMCQVYGGASRVYPVGQAWETNPYDSPLRFAYGKPDREDVTRQLIADAMGMASRGSHTVAARTAKPSRVSGQVSGVVGGRALVNLDGQFPGTLWPELVQPGLPAERLFVKGMRVEGDLDPDTRRIDLHAMRVTPEAAVSKYRAGDTILARVAGISSESCTVELFPGFDQVIPASDLVEGGVDLRHLMSVGEVLPLWFGGREADEWLLSLQDAADADAAVPAPSILLGGPPWLVPTPADQVTQPAPRTPTPLDRTADVVLEPSRTILEGIQQENAQLVARLQDTQALVRELQAQLNAARTQRREAVRRRNADFEDGNLFEDEREQLDFEINLSWARTTQPAEKRRLSLRRWTYSAHFFDTLGELQGVPRAKIVEVIVHVLTGRDAELTSRARHQLRTGTGGEDRPVVRAGGETCWRVSLQTKTPSARRLHYWQCADGSIELSSVRLHDDFRP